MQIIILILAEHYSSVMFTTVWIGIVELMLSLSFDKL